MPIKLVFRRGTSVELTTQTGSYGEVAIDTTTDSVVVFDGVTPGGIRLASEGAMQSAAPEPAFATVADMKAQDLPVGKIVDTQGYYSAGDGGHAQYIIQSGVTADEYGDHTIANGNVAVLMYSDYIFALQYGLVGDGTTDNLRSMIALADLSVPVKFPHKQEFRIEYQRTGYQSNGNTIVRWTADVDFNHSSIVCTAAAADPTGYSNSQFLEFGSKERATSHGATSPLVTLLKSQPTIPAGSFIPQLTGHPEWNNHVIYIETTTPHYVFRNIPADQIRKEMFLHNNDGRCGYDMKYDLDTSAIVSARTLPVSDSKMLVENLTLDLRQMPHDLHYSKFIYVIDGANITMRNTTYLDNAMQKWTSTNYTGIAVMRCDFIYNSTIDGVYAPWAQQSTSDTGVGYNYAYTIQAANCIDLTLEDIVSQGDGYGMVGTDENWGMTWRRCDVNRINSHKPLRHFLKVQDCTVGNHGIKTCLTGDLIVERTTFLGRGMWLGNGRFFSNRPDHGGWCDGHLIVRDCRFQAVRQNDTTGERIPMFMQEADGQLDTGSWGGMSHGYAIPPGSPIKPWNWETQTYDNCVLEKGTLILGNWTRGTRWTYETQQLTVRNFKAVNGASIIVESNHANGVIGRNRSSGWEYSQASNLWWDEPHNFEREVDGEYYSVRPNKRINIIDSDINGVYMRPEPNGTGVLDITIDNCNSNDPTKGIIVEPQFRGIYKITDSVIESIDASTTNGKVKIIAQNNTIVNPIVGGTDVDIVDDNNNYF